MGEAKPTSTGACSCGEACFTATGAPIMRVLCHCTLCQRAYRQDFADITLWPAKAIQLPGDAPVAYKRLKRVGSIERGFCRSCDQPVIAKLEAPFVALTFVPSQNLKAMGLTPPKGHIFYDTRVRDVADDLPKYAGYWASQMGFMKMMMS